MFKNEENLIWVFVNFLYSFIYDFICVCNFRSCCVVYCCGLIIFWLVLVILYIGWICCCCMRGVVIWDWGKLFMFDGVVIDVKFVIVSEIYRKLIKNF